MDTPVIKAEKPIEDMDKQELLGALRVSVKEVEDLKKTLIEVQETAIKITAQHVPNPHTRWAVYGRCST